MKEAFKSFVTGLVVLIIASFIILQPRYIGYGCNGSDLPLFAKYESDFPACKRIQPIF